MVNFFPKLEDSPTTLARGEYVFVIDKSGMFLVDGELLPKLEDPPTTTATGEYVFVIDRSGMFLVDGEFLPQT